MGAAIVLIRLAGIASVTSRAAGSSDTILTFGTSPAADVRRPMGPNGRCPDQRCPP